MAMSESRASVLEARRTDSRVRTLALAGMVGPVLFTVLVILQGLMVPAYSHVRLPISALEAWPTGWIQRLNFWVVGFLNIAFAYALHRGVQPARRGAVGIPLVVLGGIGIVLAGLFPWVMVDGVPTETPAHVVAAITAFAATGVGWLVFSRRMSVDRQWRGLSTYTMATSVVMLVLFIALGFFAIDDGTPLHPWAGLIQRVLCAVWFTLLIVLAVRLRRVVG
jgi:hypothetical membrane protein